MLRHFCSIQAMAAAVRLSRTAAALKMGGIFQ
jgi:hypothetical protein